MTATAVTNPKIDADKLPLALLTVGCSRACGVDRSKSRHERLEVTDWQIDEVASRDGRLSLLLLHQTPLHDPSLLEPTRAEASEGKVEARSGSFSGSLEMPAERPGRGGSTESLDRAWPVLLLAQAGAIFTSVGVLFTRKRP
jgi:hypothetical protein